MPGGAHVREAAFRLPLDGSGGGGPGTRGADGSIVAPIGDARLRPRPERTRASAGDAGAAPCDAPAHAGIHRVRASASGHRNGNLGVPALPSGLAFGADAVTLGN